MQLSEMHGAESVNENIEWWISYYPEVYLEPCQTSAMFFVFCEDI